MAGCAACGLHHRYFLERVTDRTVALLGDGKLSSCPAASTTTWPAARPYGPVLVLLRARPPPRAWPAIARAARKEMSRLERQIQKLDKDEVALHAKMAAVASDFAAVTELTPHSRRSSPNAKRPRRPGSSFAESAE